MSARSAYALREHALDATEAYLKLDPDLVDLRFDRARLLTELGRMDEARTAYLDILARDPAHFGALNNLGVLLFNTGYSTAARTVYAETVLRHPENPKGHVNFANALLENGDTENAQAHFEVALRLAPDQAEAHQGLAKLFTLTGDEERAFLHQLKGFRDQPVITLPYRGKGAPLPVLLIMSAAGGNIPVRHLLDDRIYLVTVIVAEFYDFSTPLPPHRLIINAIGDAELCAAGLETAKKIAAGSKAPVINRPQAVLATGRVSNATRLALIDNLVTPLAATLPRAFLTRPDALSLLADYGFTFPFLLRTPGYHTGQYFVRVDSAHEFAAALTSLPGAELTVLQYLDARSTDGKFRKYRVMFVDGELYPVHVAISQRWKVHYFTADMAGNPEHRAEDEAFLENTPGVLGPKAMKVLEQIRDALRLDYAGIDFALDQNGNVVLFEANATMIVTSPAPGACWDYRREPVARIFDATKTMFREKALT